jgi:DNA-directed RNA polymerase subunit RPC12/RpoP
MDYVVECWEECGKDFTVHAPSRGSEQLIAGVQVRCEHCGHPYQFTVDGDGEPSLDSLDDDSLGDTMSDPDATHF